MALATRNLYLVLKARDEASRVIRGFGRELTRAGRLAEAENLRTRAGLASLKAAQLAASGAAQADIDKQNLLAKTLRNQAQELERAHRASVRYANALHSVSATLITVGSGLAIAGAVGIAFLTQSIGVAKEYNRTVALTATQITDFKANLQDLSTMGLEVARNIAAPFEQIQPALYNIFSSTNASMAQAQVLLTSFAKTAVAGQVSIEDAAKGTIPILNAFNIPLEKVNSVLDIQFQLVRKGVGTYADFSSVFGRVVPSATRAGQSFETVAAMLAYLTRNGLSAAMASSSAARALDAMSNPKAVSSMEALGIKVRDAAGNMLPLEQSLQNLQKYLLALPNKDRIGALVDIFKGAGGTIQARRFLDQILLKPGELNEYIGFLNDMKNANGSFEQAYSTMSNTVAAQTTLLRNNWKVLQVNLGNAVTPAFVILLSWVNKLLTAFNGLSPNMQKVIAIGVAIVGVFGVVAGVILVVLGAIAGLAAAIIGAGASFFYLVGGVAALLGGLAAFTAALVIAWTRSAEFRAMVGDLKKNLKSLWQDVIVPTGQAIQDAWDKHMGPALTKLADVIEKKIMPAVREFYNHFWTKLLPALREVAMFVKTLLVGAFTAVSWVITNLLVPAINWLMQKYQEHKATVDMIVGVLIWLGKWIMKIAAIVAVVLAGAFVGAVLLSMLAFAAAIVAVIAVIVLLVMGIKWLVTWIGTNVPKAWDWIAAKTVAIWKSIAGFFVGVWKWIVSIFAAAWNGIVAGWNAFAGFFITLWTAFWNGPIGGLVRAVWDLIVALIKLAVAAIEFVILWGLKIITDAWNATWAAWAPIVQAVWNFIWSYLSGIWNLIVALFHVAWDGLVAAWNAVWGAVSSVVQAVWNFISNHLGGVWNTIVAGARVAWGMFYSIISSQITNVWHIITSVWDTITGFFAKAGSWLFDAGKNIIKGLIDGITSMIGDITKTVDKVTGIIKSFFPHSPAKRGPLSGSGGMYYAGKKMVQQLADGMASENATISMNAAYQAGTAASNLITPPPDSSNGGSVQQTFNINTQEINPRRHAAELGFLLAGRL